MSPETKIGKINGWDAEEFIKGEDKHYSVEQAAEGKMVGYITIAHRIPYSTAAPRLLRAIHLPLQNLT